MAAPAFLPSSPHTKNLHIPPLLLRSFTSVLSPESPSAAHLRPASAEKSRLPFEAHSSPPFARKSRPVCGEVKVAVPSSLKAAVRGESKAAKRREIQTTVRCSCKPNAKRKKKAVAFTNVTANAYQGRLNAGFSKVCEIFKVHGI